MRLHSDRLVVDDCITELVLLRRRLLRSAKALVVTEDRRAAALCRLAEGADPTAARDLQADAHQARANADSALGMVVQLERMNLHAVSRTGEPRVVELPPYNPELAFAGNAEHS